MRFPLLFQLAGDAEDRIASTRLDQRASAVVCLAIAMFATTAPSAAQVKVEFAPFVGHYAPTQDLIFPGALNHLLIRNIRQDAGPALGGRVTAWLTPRLGVGASLGYSGSGATEVQGPFCAQSIACPISSVASSTTGYAWMASLRVLYNPLPRQSMASFYFLGGPAFVVHGGYNSFNVFDGSSFWILDTTWTSLGAVFGVGAGLKVPRTALALRADLEDYLYDARFSSHWGANWSTWQFQSDLLLTLGLSVMFGSTSAR